jgi:hypothetical protein
MIACSGHSGSTLLSLCLDTHPQVAVFGEFESLEKRISHKKNNSGLCSFHKSSCQVIDDQEIRVLSHLYGNRGSLIRKIGFNLSHPYYVFHYRNRRSASIIVDSSKSVSWATKMWKKFRWILDQKLIILHRDPRGVVASFIRRGEVTDAQIRYRAECWSKEQGQIETMVKKMPESRYFRLFYEELASQPRIELGKICRFLKVEFDAQMLEFLDHEHHFIGGNAGARARIDQKNGRPPNAGRVDVDYYLKQANPIFLDERWKQDLTLGQKRIIESTCRPEMHRLGYSVEA